MGTRARRAGARRRRGADRAGGGGSGIDISQWDRGRGRGSRSRPPARPSSSFARDEVDFLMKGKVKTADLMRAALDKETGIRAGKLMSHIAVMWTPVVRAAPRACRTAASSSAPTLEQKADIIRNAVDAMHKLGLGDSEGGGRRRARDRSIPRCRHTVDAAELTRMNERGEITGCVVDGPFGFDNAVSEVAAEPEGRHEPDCGKGRSRYLRGHRRRQRVLQGD